MSGKNTAVFGLYPDRASVENAVDALASAGFRTEDISVLLPENVGTKDFAHEKHTKAPEERGSWFRDGGRRGRHTRTAGGDRSAGGSGAGPFIAAGPIMAALAGAGTGGVVGGLIGALVGMGIPEYEAKRYEGMIKKGQVLLSVHCDNSDWVKRAKDVLKQTGAEDISSSGESGADYAESDKPHVRSGGTF